MVYYTDPTDFIGQIIVGITQNITGSFFLTMLMLIFLIVIVTMAFRFPVIFSAVVVLPLIMIGATIDSDLLTTFALILIYAAFALADWMQAPR